MDFRRIDVGLLDEIEVRRRIVRGNPRVNVRKPNQRDNGSTALKFCEW